MSRLCGPCRIAACVALLVMAACGGQEEGAPPSTATPVRSSVGSTLAPATSAPPTTVAPTTGRPTTVLSTTVAPTTTEPATTPATTTLVTTSPTVPPTTTACDRPVGRDEFLDGFPVRMSSLVGTDIRTGAHQCFERVVIEMGGTGSMPGVKVGYVPDPVRLSPSDLSVDIAGSATLVVAVEVWMPDMEGVGYSGPTQFAPTNVSHILELRQIENFEGMTSWAIGLDTERDFRVSLLDAPPRVVVDIDTG